MARNETRWQNHLTLLLGIRLGWEGPQRARSIQTMAPQTHADRPSTSGHMCALAQVPGELDTLQMEGRPDLGKKVLRGRKDRTAVTLNAGPSRLNGTCP
jgi:hypothetical protein